MAEDDKTAAPGTPGTSERHVLGQSGGAPSEWGTFGRHILERRVLATIRRHDMIPPGARVLVAVSGGADSTALLLCLRRLAGRLRFSLAAAHLNHGLRGAESDADADFIRRLCVALDIPFYTETIAVKDLASAGGENLESCARRLRYDFLRRIARQSGARRIATGHNRNDQAETVLFRLLRGSGLDGFSAIRPLLPGGIIRPLLDCQRSLICKYLEEKGITWREDSSNTDRRYRRNRIRHELLPYLERYFNPRIIATLARTAELARQTRDFLDAQAAVAGIIPTNAKPEAPRRENTLLRDAARKDATRMNMAATSALSNAAARPTDQDGQDISLPVAALIALHPALQKQVLRRALLAAGGSLTGITAAHIDNILALARKPEGNGTTCLPGAWLVQRYPDRLRLRKSAPAPAELSGMTPPGYACELPIPGECFVPAIKTTFRCTIISRPADMITERKNFARRVLLNPDALPKTLTVRSRKPGDRYGGAGHRKVKKLFIDAAVPPDQRESLPCLAAGDAVIWIPGFCPARPVWLPDSATRAVLVEVELKSGER